MYILYNNIAYLIYIPYNIICYIYIYIYIYKTEIYFNMEEEKWNGVTDETTLAMSS